MRYEEARKQARLKAYREKREAYNKEAQDEAPQPIPFETIWEAFKEQVKQAYTPQTKNNGNK